MGLHTGEVKLHSTGYVGVEVHRAARVGAAGNGGQVLLSRATQECVKHRLPDGTTLRDLGEHRLRDLRHSEHLFQVVAEDVPDVTTAPRTVAELRAGDRIVITDPHAPTDDESRVEHKSTVVERTVAETLLALESVIRGDDRLVLLTTDQVRAAARHKPVDVREYRLGRVAEWSQPRYRLDGRFVDLTLLLDQGEEAIQGRWQAQQERHDDLGALLDAVPEPAVVILGPPGCGKSTLLRRHELDTAVDTLRGDADDRTTFFIQLNEYAPARPGDPPPAPGPWLAERWAARFPHLAPLDELLVAGRVTLLLDALNEMPADSEAEFRKQVELWKAWLQGLASEHPGNRVVFSCRSLDYSQPLSTPTLRVPQVRIEPLDDAHVRDFLALYSPARWRMIWSDLQGSPQLAVLRSPYFLSLLVEQVEATREMPTGRAGLFTGFVRQALRREVERGNALFEPGELLVGRDVKRVANWKWKTAYDLPERGELMRKLAELAHGMQAGRDDGERSQVRIGYDHALDLLDSDADEAIVAAGAALAVLDEDQAAGDLMYIHQLVQEYFAARTLAKAPDPELVSSEWRAAAIRPRVEEVIDGLDLADPLPGLPQTGWEETTLLAAAMAEEAGTFVSAVMEANVAVAGRCAAQVEVRDRIADEVLDELRSALIERTWNPEADLRDRIACGYALGDLGDPRFERQTGPHGEYLLPPLVEIRGGAYPIGDDEPIEWSFPGSSGITSAHVPRHEVEIGTFRIARFPVTNAEWACFMAAGGYEDEQWWDTDMDARGSAASWPTKAPRPTTACSARAFWRSRSYLSNWSRRAAFPPTRWWSAGVTGRCLTRTTSR